MFFPREPGLARPPPGCSALPLTGAIGPGCPPITLPLPASSPCPRLCPQCRGLVQLPPPALGGGGLAGCPPRGRDLIRAPGGPFSGHSALCTCGGGAPTPGWGGGADVCLPAAVCGRQPSCTWSRNGTGDRDGGGGRLHTEATSWGSGAGTGRETSARSHSLPGAPALGQGQVPAQSRETPAPRAGSAGNPCMHICGGVHWLGPGRAGAQPIAAECRLRGPAAATAPPGLCGWNGAPGAWGASALGFDGGLRGTS